MTIKAEHMLFTEQFRSKALQTIMDELEADQRIAGLVIVGSGAVGFTDRFSDIDLTAVTYKEEDVMTVFREWGVKFGQLFSVLRQGEVTRENAYPLHVVLLDGFLEIDCSFTHLDRLRASKNRWKVAFDRSGVMEATMQQTLRQREENHNESVKKTYQHHVEWFWHYVTHAMVALERNQPWKALAELEIIRNYTIELRGLREGLETKRFRHVDRMNPEFLAEIQKTLVVQEDPDVIHEAIRAAIRSFFSEASYFDAIFGGNDAEAMKELVVRYLKIIGRD